MNTQICLKCLKESSGSQTHFGLHHHCFLAWFGLSELADFTGIARKNENKAPPEPGNETLKQDNSSFFQGRFTKYSATLAGASYILKVTEADAPELPDVEYLSNQIAEQLSIPVAKYYCIDYLGKRTFVTKNFVDKKTNSNLVHIYHYQKEKAYRDCELLINIISETTSRFLDVETFVNVCLFDGLIGNHDRHGRNLGILVTHKGNALAPIYDNPSALGLESGEWLKADFSPKGRIPTKENKEPTLRDYVKEFIRLGYKEQVIAFVKKVNIQKINGLIDASFCTQLMKEAIKKLIASRARELEDELSKRSQ